MRTFRPISPSDFCTIAIYMNMRNGHIMFIYIYNTENRNLEIRKTRNNFFVQVQKVILPLSLKVLRHKEREAQSFYSGFFICTHPPPPNMCGTRHKGLREQAKTNCLPPRQVSSQLVRCLVSTNWLFQNLPKSSARFRCVTSFALCNPVSHLGLLWHLWVICLLCARAWTHVLMLHLSNPLHWAERFSA